MHVRCVVYDCPPLTIRVVRRVSCVMDVSDRVGLHRTVNGPSSLRTSDFERFEPHAQGFENKCFEHVGCASGILFIEHVFHEV